MQKWELDPGPNGSQSGWVHYSIGPIRVHYSIGPIRVHYSLGPIRVHYLLPLGSKNREFKQNPRPNTLKTQIQKKSTTKCLTNSGLTQKKKKVLGLFKLKILFNFAIQIRVDKIFFLLNFFVFSTSVVKKNGKKCQKGSRREAEGKP